MTGIVLGALAAFVALAWVLAPVLQSERQVELRSTRGEERDSMP